MTTESKDFAEVDSHMDWLRRKLVEYQQELGLAESTTERLRPIVANLRSTIEALESSSPNISLFTVEELEAIQPTVSDGPTETPAPKTSFAPGARKSAKMPERRSQYANVSIMNIVSGILGSADRPYHADELVDAIWDVQTQDERKAAKRSIVSEMLRGSSKGFWRKLGRNKYVRNE